MRKSDRHDTSVGNSSRNFNIVIAVFFKTTISERNLFTLWYNYVLALLFYFFTAFIPVGYLFYGVKTKSILFIRVALLTLVLSIVTLKIYFSLGAPIVTITLSGAVMIALSLVLMRYLKTPKNGFTREKLLHDKWDSSELTSFIVSQSLSGHQIKVKDETQSYGGGSFGGGGAGSEF